MCFAKIEVFTNSSGIVILLVISNMIMNQFRTCSANSTQASISLVKNFTCVTYNWERNVECTWNYSVSLKITKISIQWQFILSSGHSGFTLNQIWNPCPHLKDDMKSCNWNLYDDIDPYKTFKLCINNSLPLQNSSCYVVDIQGIVKPDQVSGLKATTKTSTSVKLEWQHDPYPHNKTFYLLVNQIGLPKRKIFIAFIYVHHEHQSCTTESGCTVSCDKTKMSITVTGLSKFTQYLFTVSNKPVYGGFWSNGVSIHVKTSKDVPSVSPYLEQGCYNVQLTPTKTRTVTVYWKPLPMSLWNDERIEYKVQFSTNGTVIKELYTVNFYTSVYNMSRGAQIFVKIWAKNTVGFSQNSSDMVVYYKDNRVPDNILGLIDWQDQMRVYWKHNGVDRVKYYQIFWCEKEFSNICKDTPSMTQISPWLKNGTIPMISNISSVYLIGVAYITNDNETSGFYWSDCIVDLLSKEYPFQLEVVVRQENDNVLIKWYFNRCNVEELPLLIDTYIMQICDGQVCKDYTELRILATENSLATETEKKLFCVRVVGLWNGDIKIRSTVECAHIKRNKDPMLYILLGVGSGSFVLLTAVFGCIAVIRELSKGVKKAAEPFEIQLPFVQQAKYEEEILSSVLDYTKKIPIKLREAGVLLFCLAELLTN